MDVVWPQMNLLVDHLGEEGFRSDLSDHELVLVRLVLLFECRKTLDSKIQHPTVCSNRLHRS